MKAATEAQSSAQTAQNNAAEAAAKASISNLHDIHSSISSYGSSSDEHVSEHGSESSPQRTVSAPAQKNTANNNQQQQQQQQNNKDQTAKASSIRDSTASAKSIDTIATNHNYGNSEFRPSKQYSYAGY